MRLKNLLPKTIKLKIRLFKRFLSDRKIDFAITYNYNIQFKNKISTCQEIKKGAFFENKIHNIKIASKKIDSLIIMPNQIFSFWKIIGSPQEKHGFKKGRNIINGKLSEEIGGGLCQLSSIIYLTSLKGNLDILEIFNHSVDIYKEEDRFTPLGADATVVYAYKDLRIRNNYSFPLKFSFEFKESNIICTLESQEKIVETNLDFIRNYKENFIEVITQMDEKFYALSVYKFHN